MKREPRNSDIKFKPAVVSWFKNRPDAQAHFDPVKEFLVSCYSGSNYGFINKKAYPEYRFNSVGNNEVYVVIRASQNHTLVRVRVDSLKVKIEFDDYYKTIANKHGERIDVYDFVVSKTSDLKIISDFFRKHEIHNFTAQTKRDTHL
ncbi:MULTISPECIES: hypothetical protein [unclassified Pseudoalteromonas]|uniref:hypothetical protein n=1 Tax=unclassified Pseudoalteromonas TaxID=194690 RepID=UPI00390C705C